MGRLGQAIGLCLLLLTAGCQREAPPVVETATPWMGATGALQLQTLDVVFRDDFQPRYGPPNVEHLMPLRPHELVRQWAEQRFRAVGRVGTLMLVLKDASVVEQRLQAEGGLAGAFTNEPTRRWIGLLELEVRPIHPNSTERSSFTITAERSTTDMENDTLAEVEGRQAGLARALLADLDQAVIQRLNRDYPGLVAPQ